MNPKFDSRRHYFLDKISGIYVKLSDHVLTTRKLIKNRKSTGKSIDSDENHPRSRQKIVRIISTDLDATDSSDDEEKLVLRVKRHVRRIEIESHVKICRNVSSSVKSSERFRLSESDALQQKKFRGVRRRQWGRWAAEIRDRTLGKRLWLGTFDTPEEAAAVYDNAAVRLKGPDAITNFPSGSQTQTTVTTDSNDLYTGSHPGQGGDVDEEESGRRVKKRHVRQMNNVSPAKKERKVLLVKNNKRFRSPGSDEHQREGVRFRGIHQTETGSLGARITDPTLGKRLWLGTYKTPEEAAAVYDIAALMFMGPDAVTNFPSVSQG